MRAQISVDHTPVLEAAVNRAVLAVQRRFVAVIGEAKGDDMTKELFARIDQPLELKASDFIAQVAKIESIMRAAGDARRKTSISEFIPGNREPNAI